MPKPRPLAQDEYEEQVKREYPGYPGPVPPQRAPLPGPRLPEPRSVPLAPEGVESPLASWARRLIIGPRSIVEQTLREEAQTRRDTAQSREAMALEGRRETRGRENLLLQIREQARVNEETEARKQAAKRAEEQAARTRLMRGVIAAQPAPEGEPEMRPRREEIIQEPGGAEMYKALREKPEAIKTAPPEHDVLGPRGEIIRKGTPKPTKAWYEGLTLPEMAMMEANLQAKAGTATPVEKAQLAELQAGMKTYERVSGTIAGAKARETYPYRPLTEIEQRSMDWIEGLSTFANRFEQFTPEQLQAVTTLPGWLKGKWGTLSKGMLPQIFGAPGEREQLFADINALMAEAEQLSFKLGGQQLTPMEKETVMAFVPNRGDLINPVVLAAKLGNLRTSLGIVREMRMWRMQTPRGSLSIEAYDQALKAALTFAGVKIVPDLPKDAPKDPKGRTIPGGVRRGQ